jgi:tetratricopeptide (TPR) repeat protein
MKVKVLSPLTSAPARKRAALHGGLVSGVVFAAIGMVLCLAHTGCKRKAEAPRALRRSSALPADPFAFILVRHDGEGTLDTEIRRVQEQVRRGRQREPLIERLGWLFVRKARASFDPGFYKLAEQCALAIQAGHPESQDALLLRGHVLHNLHRFKEAEPLARNLVSNRGLPFDWGLLSDVLMEQGKLDEAADACQKMVDLRPDLHSYARGAHLRWLKGNVRGAANLMRMAAGAATPQDRESAAWVNTRLAGYEFQLGAVSEAERSCALALDFQKDYPPALLLRGRLLLTAGDYAAAAGMLRRAAELNPLPEYQWALSEALRANGQPDEAARVEAELRQNGAATDPRTYSLYLATRNESAELALRLARAELNCRGDLFTQDALGWALAAAGKPEEARRAIDRALVEGTKDARLFFHAAVVMEKNSRHVEALRWAHQAAELQHMLLPSERAQLHNFPLADTVMARSGN